MTVIAYRDGILAADTGLSMDDIYVGNVKKIIVRYSLMYATFGALIDVAKFSKWVDAKFDEHEKPAKLEDRNDFGALICHRSGLIEKVNGDWDLHPLPNNIFIAEGCHREFMSGIMCQGGTAIQAIDMAILHGHYARGYCTAFDVKSGEQIYGPAGL